MKRRDADVYAGVEAGGTTFAVAAGTGPDDVMPVERFPTAAPAPTLARAVDTIRDLTAGSRLRAVGVASFGPLDLRADSATFGSLRATPKRDWTGTDMIAPFRDAFDVPVALDTDVNGAAVGEARWGATRGLDVSVYVTVGTGIGGGAIVHGEPVHGLTHSEVGHLLVRRHPEDDYEGGCPFHGDCLEGLAAGPAIEKRWGRPGHELDPDAGDALEVEAWYLAQLVATLTYVLSPERVVLGGGVLGMDGLLEAVRARTADVVSGYIDTDLVTTRLDDYVVPPGLGDRSGVLGAIALAGDLADG